jgi:hypothetical protein
VDAPLRLPDPRLQARLAAAIDAEGKIGRALEALGPVRGGRVLLVEASPGGRQARSQRALGARLTTHRSLRLDDLPAASFDLVVICWRDLDDADLAPAAARLAPGGRLILVQAYGRDDVAPLAAPAGRPVEGWNERAAPRPGPGWRIRTLHCWWTFGSLRGARSFLGAAFPEVGPAAAATLRRPRLSFKVGIHHRDLEPHDPQPRDTASHDLEPAAGR